MKWVTSAYNDSVNGNITMCHNFYTFIKERDIKPTRQCSKANH